MSRTSRPGTEREWLICFPQDSKKSKSNKSCGSHSSQALDLACGVLGWPWQLISSLGPSGAGNGTCPRQLFLKWENSWSAWLWELITEWTKAIVSDIALFLDNVCVQSRPSWNFKKHGMTGEYLRSFEVVDYYYFFHFSPQSDTSTLLTWPLFYSLVRLNIVFTRGAFHTQRAGIKSIFFFWKGLSGPLHIVLPLPLVLAQGNSCTPQWQGITEQHSLGRLCM